MLLLRSKRTNRTETEKPEKKTTTRKTKIPRADDFTLYYVTIDEQQRPYRVYRQTVDMGGKIGTIHMHAYTPTR